MRSLLLCAGVSGLLFVSGCRTLVVSEGDKEIKGVPFLVKVPDKIQTTVWSQIEVLRVSGTITVKAGSDAVVTKIFEDPYPVRASEKGRERLRALQTWVDGQETLLKTNPARFANAFRAEVMAIAAAVSEQALGEPTMESNVPGVDLVISQKQYHLQPKMPLLGSATHTFKLATDGTLTETTTSATDNTGATLLGMLPVGPFLAKRWIGVGAIPDSAWKSYALLANKSSIGIPGVAVTPETPAPGGATTTTFDLTIDQEPVVYTVRARCAFGEKPCTIPAKVKLVEASKAMPGEGGYTVELVSTQRPGSPAPTKKEAPGYSISGKIVPPDPAK